MQYLGDYRIDDYITFGAQLHRFSSGAVYAPTGNVTYTFYENNSTSGAPTGGNLAQLNSKTGLYTARVQLTAANGFEVGKEYLIHIEATVDSVAAAELLMFRTVANPKVDVDTIKTQTVTCDAGVTVLASVGTAATSTAQTGDSYARLGAPAGASVSADITDIEGKVDDLEGRLTAARAGYLDNINNAALQTTVAQTGDSYARLGAPAGASVSADIAAVKADTAAILEDTDDIGVAGAGLTAIPWNAAWDAEVQSEATDALNAYDPPTKAQMEARTLPAANYATAAALDAVDNYVDTEIAAIKAKTDNLPASPAAVGSAMTLTAAYDAAKTAASQASVDAVDNYVDTEVAAIKTVTDKIDGMLELDGAVYRYTTNALEQAPSGGGGGTTDWTADERTAIRAILGIPSSGTTPEDPTTGILDTIRDDIAGLNDLSQAEAQAASAAALVAYGPPTNAQMEARTLPAANYATAAALDAVDNYVDTEIAAIKAKTDNLPASPAAVGSAMTLTAAYDAAKTAASQASVDAIDDYIDTEVAAIKAKTDQLTFTGTDVKATLDGEAVTASSVTDKTGYALTAAYDAAKTAASQASVDAVDNYVDTEVAAIKAVTDKLDTMVELDGAAYCFTTDALVNTPSEIGDGSITVVYPVRDPDGAAVANARVRVTLHGDPTIFVAQAYSNTLGNATFHLDPGTYDFYSYHNEHSFNNPDTEVVAAL